MIGALFARLPRRVAFLGFNAAVLLAGGLFVVEPLAERFSDRADAMAQDGVDLARQEVLRTRALAPSPGAPPGDLFLPGHDEATANADLQQILKTLAGQTGVRFIAVRGLAAGRARPEGSMVTARLDVEGSVTVIGALIQAIEKHAPCLFVGALTLRANAFGPAAAPGDLTAQLTILSPFQRAAVAGSGS